MRQEERALIRLFRQMFLWAWFVRKGFPLPPIQKKGKRQGGVSSLSFSLLKGVAGCFLPLCIKQIVPINETSEYSSFLLMI